MISFFEDKSAGRIKKKWYVNRDGKIHLGYIEWKENQYRFLTSGYTFLDTWDLRRIAEYLQTINEKEQ